MGEYCWAWNLFSWSHVQKLQGFAPSETRFTTGDPRGHFNSPCTVQKQCLREFQLLNASFLKITFLHYKKHLILCLSFSLLANIQHHPFIDASSPKGLRSQNSDINWHLVSACFTNLFQSATETADFVQKHFKYVHLKLG